MTDLKRKFEQDGYVVIREVVPDDLLHEARLITDEITKYFESNDHDPFKRYFLKHRVDQGTLYDLYYRHPQFQKLASHTKVISYLNELIGIDLYMYENSLVYKPAGKRNEVPWHQDFMNRPNEPPKYIIWIALDDVTIKNGALKYLPGTHKRGFMPFIKIKGETHHTRLDISQDINLENYEYAEMNAGDILIFHHLVIHSSDRISSHSPRRAYRFSVQEFNELYTPRGVPIVLSGGRPNSYINAHSKDESKNFAQLFLNKIGRKLSNI